MIESRKVRAALRHAADEASDALLYNAVIPGWARVDLGVRLRNRNACQEHAGNKSEKSAAPTRHEAYRINFS
jgi:hypothetical protein